MLKKIYNFYYARHIEAHVEEKEIIKFPAYKYRVSKYSWLDLSPEEIAIYVARDLRKKYGFYNRLSDYIYPFIQENYYEL